MNLRTFISTRLDDYDTLLLTAVVNRHSNGNPTWPPLHHRVVLAIQALLGRW